MRTSFLRIFLSAYLLLAITFLITYSSSLDEITRTWEGNNLNITGMCRVVGEPVPLGVSGLYEVDFPKGVHVITTKEAITKAGKADVNTRGVYIEFAKPINESVQVKMKPIPDWKGVLLALTASLVGGVAVASAFRIIGLE